MRSNPNEPGKVTIAPPMVYVKEKIAWEYKRLVRNLCREGAPAEEELNRLGKDGWELVGALNDSTSSYFYFKRIKGS